MGREVYGTKDLRNLPAAHVFAKKASCFRVGEKNIAELEAP